LWINVSTLIFLQKIEKYNLMLNRFFLKLINNILIIYIRLIPKKIKTLIPTKYKNYVRKFKKFNAYNELDKKMLKFINYRNGFYIDCGANDGVNQSTTWYFEKYLNWKGILIEPLPKIYKELKLNRSESNFFFNNALVSSSYKKKSIKMIDFDDSITAKVYNSRFSNNLNKKSINVKAFTLNNILEKIHSRKRFDFFSLDVEGAELEVLNGIDFNKYTFNYILVETSNFKILKSFLVKKNYRFVERLSNYNIKHLPEFGDYLFKYAN
jgi:FkbM family methyltransferase